MEPLPQLFFLRVSPSSCREDEIHVHAELGDVSYAVLFAHATELGVGVYHGVDALGWVEASHLGYVFAYFDNIQSAPHTGSPSWGERECVTDCVNTYAPAMRARS